jgi:hypothetical protein
MANGHSGLNRMGMCSKYVLAESKLNPPELSSVHTGSGQSLSPIDLGRGALDVLINYL